MKNASPFWEYVIKRQLQWAQNCSGHRLYSGGDVNDIFRDYHFCNNYREADRTTMALLSWVKTRRRRWTAASLAFNVLAYRFFNGPQVVEEWWPNGLDLVKFSWKALADQLLQRQELGERIFRGAYRICPVAVDSSYRPESGVVQTCLALAQAAKTAKHWVRVLSGCSTGHEAVHYLSKGAGLPKVGEFLAYQVVLDLAYLAFWGHRIHDDSFYILGPGAIAGVSDLRKRGRLLPDRFFLRLYDEQFEEGFLDQMAHRYAGVAWPELAYPRRQHAPLTLSMNNVEFALCEFHKYNVARGLVRGRRRRRKHVR